MKKFLLSCLVVVILMASFFIFAFLKIQSFSKNEDPKYWNDEISAIEARYDGDVPKEVIVFVGSSSIRKWDTLEEDMAPYSVVNHGFGGSKIRDVTHYVDRLIIPFQPKAIVLFVGTNDINGIRGNSKSGEEVYDQTVALFETLREKAPGAHIYYISISPTKARWKVWADAKKANELISRYASEHSKFTFIDTTSHMINNEGKPNTELLIWDGLHLNEQGYEVWTSVIYPKIEADFVR